MWKSNHKPMELSKPSQAMFFGLQNSAMPLPLGRARKEGILGEGNGFLLDNFFSPFTEPAKTFRLFPITLGFFERQICFLK